MFGERIKHKKYTFHLKNGHKLKIKASGIDLSYSRVDGSCTRYSITDAVGSVPIYIDVSDISAVTIK